MRSSVLAPILFAVPLVAQTWVQLPDFPGAARDDAARFTINGSIYVGTGRDAGFALTNDWWRFDTGAGTWSQVASLPASPRQYCAGFTVGDTGFVFGGTDDNGALSELWAYYPEQDLWVQRASMPAQARSTCVAAEGWNYGIVATGLLADGTPTNEAWRYTPSTDQWEALSPVPGPPRHHAAGCTGYNGVLVAGGADGNNTALDDAWSYAVWFETGDWYPVETLPSPRYWFRAAGPDLVMLLGGLSDATTLHDDVWVQGNTGWEVTAAFGGGPRKGGVLASVANTPWVTSFYSGLGIDGSNTRKKDWWKLEVTLAIGEQERPPLGVFPNPAMDHITLAPPLGVPIVEVRVFDALGRCAVHASMADAYRKGTVDISTLAPGRYEVVADSRKGALHGTFTKLP